MSWRGGSIKRDKTDILFSHLIRERADWVCEYCKRDFKHNHHGIHCSHIFGRAHKGVRVHPLNAVAHCAYCHDKLSQHPLEFAEWVKSIMGKGDYERLQLMANKPTKFSPFEKELIHKHYLKEKKRLKALRLEGVTGRIEFTCI